MSRQKGKKDTPQAIIDEIMVQHERGRSIKELATAYEMPFKTVKNMVTRENHKKAAVKVGIMPQLKGRPRKDKQLPCQSKDAEIKRLRMENELLRDFLHVAGKR